MQHIKLTLDAYQKEKYPELAHSLPNHSKSKVKTPESILRSIKDERLSIKEQLLTSLDRAYNNAFSLNDFLRQLQEQGLDFYYRNDKLQGIKFDGETKFRLSRLGYTEEKLQTLNQERKEEEKALAELQEFRTTKERTLQPNQQTPKNEREEEQQDAEDKLLQELVALRGEVHLRDLEAPTTTIQSTIYDELELLSGLRENNTISLER